MKNSEVNPILAVIIIVIFAAFLAFCFCLFIWRVWAEARKTNNYKNLILFSAMGVGLLITILIIKYVL